MTDSSVTRGFGLLEKFLAQKRAQKVSGLIPPLYRRGRILDLGSGSYPLFLSTVSFAEKWGIDKVYPLSPEKEDIDHPITLLHHDIGSGGFLPFNDGYFHVVTMLAVLEHVAHDRMAFVFGEVYRILKSEGLFIITTPAPWTGCILEVLAKIRLVSPEEVGEHKALYTAKSILTTLRHVGFPSQGIHLGYFELFMNTWVLAQK